MMEETLAISVRKKQRGPAGKTRQVPHQQLQCVRLLGVPIWQVLHGIWSGKGRGGTTLSRWHIQDNVSAAFHQIQSPQGILLASIHLADTGDTKLNILERGRSCLHHEGEGSSWDFTILLAVHPSFQTAFYSFHFGGTTVCLHDGE